MDFRPKCQSLTIKLLENKLGTDFLDRVQKSLPLKENVINDSSHKFKTFTYQKTALKR